MQIFNVKSKLKLTTSLLLLIVSRMAMYTLYAQKMLNKLLILSR